MGAAQAGESSATKNVIVGILAFGFLFGALFPLINNGLRIGTAGQEMSGAATGQRRGLQRARGIGAFCNRTGKSSGGAAC